MMKTAIPAILNVLVSQGKKSSDTGIVGIAAIPNTIPKTIPKVRDTCDTKSIRNGLILHYNML